MNSKNSMDKFDDAPIDSTAYYQLWGKHEFNFFEQRNILLHFIHENKLDELFIGYLDYHAPIDPESGRRIRGDYNER